MHTEQWFVETHGVTNGKKLYALAWLDSLRPALGIMGKVEGKEFKLAGLRLTDIYTMIRRTEAACKVLAPGEDYITDEEVERQIQESQQTKNSSKPMKVSRMEQICMATPNKVVSKVLKAVLDDNPDGLLELHPLARSLNAVLEIGNHPYVAQALQMLARELKKNPNANVLALLKKKL